MQVSLCIRLKEKVKVHNRFIFYESLIFQIFSVTRQTWSTPLQISWGREGGKSERAMPGYLTMIKSKRRE